MSTGRRERLGSVEMFGSRVSVAWQYEPDAVEISRYDKRERTTAAASMEPATAALLVRILADIDDWDEFCGLVKNLRAAASRAGDA